MILTQKINISILFQLAAIGIIPLLLGSCGSTLSNFQTAKTVEKKKFAVGYGVSIGNRNDYSITANQKQDTLLSGSVPVLDLYMRYGLTDKADLGLKWSMLSGEFILDGKYRFFGEERDEFFAAGGFGAGYSRISSTPKSGDTISSSWVITGTNLYFPVFFSYNPSEYFGVYVIPKYIMRFLSSEDRKAKVKTNINAHVYGVTIGTLFGFSHVKKSWLFNNTPRISIELTFAQDTELKKGIWQLGFGISYNIN